MALGKDYEMAHQYPSEALLGSEQFKNREEAASNLGMAAMYLANVNVLVQECYDKGVPIDEDLQRAANFAGKQYNDAIRWQLETSVQIREAGL